jgi:uncharacterized membrane protein YdfJ with MMPL/SSD domain
MEHNAELRAQIDREIKIEEAAAQRVPAFATVRVEVAAALGHLISRRTAAWHRTVFLASAMLMRLMLVAFSSGPKTAKVVGKSLRQPSTRDARGWRLAGSC